MKPLPKGVSLAGLALVAISSISGEQVRALGNEIGAGIGVPWLGAALQLGLILAGAALSVFSHSLTGTGGKPPKEGP